MVHSKNWLSLLQIRIGLKKSVLYLPQALYCHENDEVRRLGVRKLNQIFMSKYVQSGAYLGGAFGHSLITQRAMFCVFRLGLRPRLGEKSV